MSYRLGVLWVLGWVLSWGSVPSHAADCEPSFLAFSAKMHPLLRAKCAGCHDAAGPGPGHSVADAREAYRAATNLVNFDNLPESSFISMTRNRHWLEHDSRAEGASTAEIQAALEAWWTHGANQCHGLNGFVTTSIPLPADLPTLESGKFKALRWDLSLLAPKVPGLENAYFEIEAQRFNAAGTGFPGSFRWRKPRIATERAAVAFRGIRILLNKTFNPLENAYLGLFGVVPPGPVFAGAESLGEFPVLSSSPMILIEKRGFGDEVSIAFDKISVAAPMGCKNQAGFQSNAIPAFVAGKCFDCHGGGPDRARGTLPARALFSMADEAPVFCAKALSRVERANLDNSALITYPLQGSGGHPIVNGVSLPELKQSWLTWIRSEL